MFSKITKQAVAKHDHRKNKIAPRIMCGATKYGTLNHLLVVLIWAKGIMDFSLTTINVLMLVALAIPGYILVKTKLVKPTVIAAFSVVLLYVNQPFLTLYSFIEIEYSQQLLANLGITFLISLLSQFLVFLVLWLIFKKKFNVPILQLKGLKAIDKNAFLQTNADFARTDVQMNRRGEAYRVLTLACTFGNVGFLGIPVLKALLPISPEAIVYSAVYIVTMNLLCWTVGVAVLTGDKKYISPKKALLNPPTFTLIIALPIFFLGVQIPQVIVKGISFFAEMTTPLSMLILGMRFATSPLKQLFTDRKVWMSSLIKNLIFPLAVFAVMYFLPIDKIVKTTIFILSAMPSASATLNISELYNSDTVTAVNAVLFSTLLCIITIPVLMLLA